MMDGCSTTWVIEYRYKNVKPPQWCISSYGMIFYDSENETRDIIFYLEKDPGYSDVILRPAKYVRDEYATKHKKRPSELMAPKHFSSWDC